MAATYRAEAIVLRSVRFGEGDAVVALQTLERGRVSVFAKGVRNTKSALRGRLQPGVCVRLELAPGKGDLHGIRGAHVIDAHAGLWVAGYRIQAASCVLEAALRVCPEEEPNPGAFHLLSRSLSLLAVAPPRSTPARFEPIVLGTHVKLLVAAGLLPQLGGCVACGADGPITGFSGRLGGVLCAECRDLGEELEPAVHAALAALVGRPLAEADAACPVADAPGVERVVGLIMRDHLGVTLRSATPL